MCESTSDTILIISLSKVLEIQFNSYKDWVCIIRFTELLDIAKLLILIRLLSKSRNV